MPSLLALNYFPPYSNVVAVIVVVVAEFVQVRVWWILINFLFFFSGLHEVKYNLIIDFDKLI